ncbi:hypothetical protein PsorP6_006797 [Peronosclerospora sorghi]|uniref:Uncharacterized protein n=1 Tax=Peronosclerospora sorghi TaxID=230839 RepID=A0ACC0W511_9STRA|nr:hypothetical protein PsorP6_006797 [Peronosclerospora sorghi]
MASTSNRSQPHPPIDEDKSSLILRRVLIPNHTISIYNVRNRAMYKGGEGPKATRAGHREAKRKKILLRGIEATSDWRMSTEPKHSTSSTAFYQAITPLSHIVKHRYNSPPIVILQKPRCSGSSSTNYFASTDSFNQKVWEVFSPFMAVDHFFGFIL